MLHELGSGKAKITDEASTKWGDVAGLALLGRSDPGRFPKHRRRPFRRCPVIKLANRIVPS